MFPASAEIRLGYASVCDNQNKRDRPFLHTPEWVKGENQKEGEQPWRQGNQG